MVERLPRVHVEPVIDLHTIQSVCDDLYIKNRLSHDHRELSPIIHPDVRYLGAYVNDVLVGFFMLIEVSWGEIEIHAMLRKEAISVSRRLGHLCIEYAFSDKTIKRLTALIIEGLGSAKNYCIKLGFKDEGFKRNACVKNGKLIGVHLLGLTREDWEGTQNVVHR